MTSSTSTSLSANSPEGGSSKEPPPRSQPVALVWVGRILTWLPAAALCFSTGTKLTQAAEVIKAFETLGYPLTLVVPIGLLELCCVLIYIIPRTRVLGLILLTAYLGGACATHVRISDDWAGPVIIGVMIWVGFLLSDPRARSLLPITQPPTKSDSPT